MRRTVIVSSELIWRMKGQDGETAGEPDKYHGFVVTHYRSMLEKLRAQHCMSEGKRAVVLLVITDYTILVVIAPILKLVLNSNM